MSKNTLSPKKVSFLFFLQFPLKPLFIVFPALHCSGPKKFWPKQNSVHENARFFSLPDTNSVRQFLLKIHFFTFLNDHLKKPIFIGFFGLFHFFSVSISPTQKTKNAIFFSKTSFLITQNFAKTLF